MIKLLLLATSVLISRTQQTIDDVNIATTAMQEEAHRLLAIGYIPALMSNSLIVNRANVQARTNCAETFFNSLNAQTTRLSSAAPNIPVVIGLAVTIANLDDVSDMDQTVTMTTIMTYKWADYRLFYLNTDPLCANETYVLPNLLGIWYPTYMIENEATGTVPYKTWEKYTAKVRAGSITWTTNVRMVLSCDMNFKMYPFDWQNCYVLFRFIYDIHHVVITAMDPYTALKLLHSDMVSPLWDITGQEVRYTLPTAGLKIYFRLVRKPNYYIWVLFIPTVLISLGTVLTFVLPSDSDQKMGTMLTLMLSYFIFLVTLTTTTPQTSDSLPILIKFYISVIALGVGGAFAASVISRLKSNSKNKTQSTWCSMPSFLSCSLDRVNTIVLVLYVGCLVATYIYLFIDFMEERRRQMANDAAQYNYTDITAMH